MLEIAAEKEIPIKLMKGGNQTHLMCPKCGTVGNHFASNGSVVNRQMPNTNHYELHTPMMCEGGHGWTLVLEFHKGVTTLRCLSGKDECEWQQSFNWGE